MFLNKEPCRRARVLDLSHCPPPGLVHSIYDYAIYYDAIYYPELHDDVFSSPEACVSWLHPTLNQHATCCLTCRSLNIPEVSVTWNLKESRFFLLLNSQSLYGSTVLVPSELEKREYSIVQCYTAFHEHGH